MVYTSMLCATPPPPTQKYNRDLGVDYERKRLVQVEVWNVKLDYETISMPVSENPSDLV